MRVTIRTKLMIILGSKVFAFTVLICAQAILTSRMEKQLRTIQRQYIPVMEFGPRLESGFEHLRRSFQDSVAAQDQEALAKTVAIKNAFLGDIESAGEVVDPLHAVEIRESTEDYYSSAYAVSQRLMSGDTGVTLTNAMTLMQAKQLRIEALLKKALTLDRARLQGAFSAIAQTQQTSARILLFASMASLVVVALLSVGLSQTILRSVRELSSGFIRFGRGDFSQPLLIQSRDELGDMAKEANLMADRIKNLVKELESFSYSVAHDLRAPLRSMMGFSSILLEEHGAYLNSEAKSLLERVKAAAKRMGSLIDSLLSLSNMARLDLKKNPVNLSELAKDILAEFQSNNPQRMVLVTIAEKLIVQGDASLLHIVLTNLLGNAWKFTSKTPDARIEFGLSQQKNKEAYFVRDNGAGFDMQFASKLFGTFQRLHSSDEFEGTGIGLATVRSIIRRHDGETWAEAIPEHGAVFYFTIGRN